MNVLILAQMVKNVITSIEKGCGITEISLNVGAVNEGRVADLQGWGVILRVGG